MATMQKEGAQLVEMFEKANKAANNVENDDAYDSEETRCIDALKALRAVNITTSLLMETQVAKRLRKLTKHKSSKISSLSQDIITAWRKVVAAESASKKEKPTSSSKSNVESKASGKSSVTKDTSESLSTTKSEKVKAVTQTEVETQTKVKVETEVKTTSTVSASKSVASVASTNGFVSSARTSNETTSILKIPKTGDSTRDKIRESLVEAFAKVQTEAQEELLQKVKRLNIIDVAVTVEIAMFKKLGLSKDANRSKYRSIMFNIRDSNNPDFRRRVLLGEIEPEELTSMSVDDMASNARKAENKKIKDKALFECERGLKAAASTDQFKCGKCKQRKCTYYQMQTRSADEPMTTFVTCVNCSNTWKFC